MLARDAVPSGNGSGAIFTSQWLGSRLVTAAHVAPIGRRDPADSPQDLTQLAPEGSS
jgi:hypothetical protein